MLVLSRKKQQSVVVASPTGTECLIKITVVGIFGSRVKLGLEAADDVAVHRWEVWERIKNEGSTAKAS